MRFRSLPRFIIFPGGGANLENIRLRQASPVLDVSMPEGPFRQDISIPEGDPLRE